MLNFALYIDNHNVTRFELNGRVDVSGSLLSHLLSLLFLYVYTMKKRKTLHLRKDLAKNLCHYG